MNKHIALSPPKVFTLDFSIFGIAEDAIKRHFSQMPNPYDNPKGAIDFAGHQSTTSLLAPFLHYLETYQDGPAIKLSGIPIDANLPETPGIDHSQLKDSKQTFISEGLLVAASLRLGVPYSFKAEFNNQLIHQVRPVQEKKDSSTSLGSEKNLGFHQEVGFSELKPDFIFLLGLRRGDQVQPTYTQLFFNKDIADALDHQNQEFVSTLQKPLFRIHPTPAFNRDGLSDTTYSPLIKKDRLGHYDISYMANAFIDVAKDHPKALDALEALKNICETGYSVKVEILPGDMVLVNNKKTLHARTPFNPQFENPFSLRWLQRIYVKKNLQGKLESGYMV